MLVLKRSEGEWLEFQHKSGDVIRVRLYNIRHGHTQVACDDPAYNFAISRPDKDKKPRKLELVTDRT